MNALNPSAIREDFPGLHQRVYGKPLVYLDSAATAQKPKAVIEAVNEMNAGMNGNIHRVMHYLGMQSTERYEQAREVIRGFINAPKTQEIIFTAGTTAAINLVAFSYGEQFVHKGDEIIVTEAEHHSNIVPWQLLCARKEAVLKVLPVDDSGRLMLEKLPELLRSGKVRMLAVSQMSNVLGVVNPIKEIVQMAHACRVPVLVDGAQGIVHSPTDVQALDCDFYVFSGHKLYGPTGIGVLYGKVSWLEQMPPYQGGGDMIDTVSFKKTSYAELPLKFEAGTTNFIGAYGLSVAVDYLQKTGLEAIHRYEHELLEYALQKLTAMPGLQLYGTASPKAGLLSFTLNGVHPLDAATVLDKLGIAVRTGHLCAEPLMQRLGAPSMIRASMAFYNTKEEIDALVAGLAKVQKMFAAS
jgi:cysteine desulfurase/selenocysteine lyase